MELRAEEMQWGLIVFAVSGCGATAALAAAVVLLFEGPTNSRASKRGRRFCWSQGPMISRVKERGREDCA